MSATKKADNQFLAETRLLVRNDRTPKRNKALDTLTFNFEPIDDNITLANKKENSLRLLNDRIGQRTENPTGDFITNSNYDPERDELLKEYNSQYPSSFEYTDEEGNKKYRKFLLPEFDVDFDETVIEPASNPQYISHQTNQVLKRLNQRQEELAEVTRRETELKDSPQPTFLHKAKIGILLHNIERKKAYILREIADEQLRFDALQRRRDLVNQEQKDVERQNAVIRENNKSKIKAYADTLQLLNKGKMNTEQQANETDEEYLNRLRRNAEVEVPNEQLQDMKFSINQKFRKNMKSLLKNDVLIEQVMNSLSDTDKNNINKRMPLFKTEFEKTFGVNNKLIEIPDVLSFIRKFLEVNIMKESVKEDEEAGFHDSPIYEEEYEDARHGFEEVEDNIRRRRNEMEQEQAELDDEPQHGFEEQPEIYDPVEEEQFYDAVEPIHQDKPKTRFRRPHLIKRNKTGTPNKNSKPTPASPYPTLEGTYDTEPFRFQYNGNTFYFYVAEKPNNVSTTYKILISESGEKGSFVELRAKTFNENQVVRDIYKNLLSYFEANTPRNLAKKLLKISLRVIFNIRTLYLMDQTNPSAMVSQVI